MLCGICDYIPHISVYVGEKTPQILVLAFSAVSSLLYGLSTP